MKLLVIKSFPFSPNGFDRVEYKASEEPQELSKRAAEIALAEGWACLEGDIEHLIENLEDEEPAPVTPHVPDSKTGWYDVIGYDGQPVNKGGKLRKDIAHQMLEDYLAGDIAVEAE